MIIKNGLLEWFGFFIFLIRKGLIGGGEGKFDRIKEIFKEDSTASNFALWKSEKTAFLKTRIQKLTHDIQKEV